MPGLVDPYEGLLSFQQALSANVLKLHRGERDPGIRIHVDKPQDDLRYTYAVIEGDVATAIAILVMVEPVEGLPCFQIGYAVPTEYRRQGRGKRIVSSAIDELSHGLARHGIRQIFVEAIVGKDNLASQRVASATLTAEPAEVTDGETGLPVLQYLKRVTT